jgi:hypothetical protein
VYLIQVFYSLTDDDDDGIDVTFVEAVSESEIHNVE